MGRRKNSKAKGNRFEIQVCRMLTDWWFPGEYDSKAKASELPFRRAWGSGGWDKRGDPGDVKLITSLDFPFSVEAKNRQSWSFDALLKGNKNCELLKYWEQTLEDASVNGLIPLLLFTRNYDKVYAAIPSAFAYHLNVVSPLFFPFVTIRVEVADGMTILLAEELMNVPRSIIERAVGKMMSRTA